MRSFSHQQDGSKARDNLMVRRVFCEVFIPRCSYSAINRFSANGHWSSIHWTSQRKPVGAGHAKNFIGRILVAAFGPDGFAIEELDGKFS